MRHHASRYALIVLLATLIAAVLALPTASRASFRPAPQRIIHAATSHRMPHRGTPAKRAWIICRIFRSSCVAALNVAWCESSLRPWAVNGQYHGMFQMGSGERARYGDARDAWGQARAARRYQTSAGWSPWSCHP